MTEIFSKMSDLHNLLATEFGKDVARQKIDPIRSLLRDEGTQTEFAHSTQETQTDETKNLIEVAEETKS